MAQPVLSVERSAARIYLIRGKKVMLARDLAKLCGVPTSGLTQLVKRNIERFPEDLAFRLTCEEFNTLMSQIVIPNPPRGARRNLPLAFTEDGVSMLSIIMRSKRATQLIRTTDWLG
jgi:hypothetical protein